MERERSLYMFVYRILLSCIFNGTYGFQDKLPSLSDLCKQYGVGRNTIRSALLELQKDGYVSLHKGVQAVVVFNRDSIEGSQHYQQVLADSKEMIDNIFETMEVLLPEFSTECYRMRNEIRMAHLTQLIERFDIEHIHNDADMMLAMTDIFQCIFGFSENPLIAELFYTLISHAYLPLVSNRQSSKRMEESVKESKLGLKMIISLAQSNRISAAKKCILLLCKAQRKYAMQYIGSFCLQTPIREKKEFIWVCNRNNDYLYANVVLDILNDLTRKIYVNQSTLPSISELAGYYEVSEKTIRKALEVLREYKVIETRNGIGSRICMNVYDARNQLLKSEGIAHNLKMFSYAVQVYLLLVKAVYPKYLKQIPHERMGKLCDQSKENTKDFLTSLSKEVFRYTNDCLSQVFEEVSKTVKWYSFANMLYANEETELDEIRMKLYYAACKRNNKQIVIQAEKLLRLEYEHVCSLLERKERDD